MRFLRSNTAVIVTVGPFYDKTDGVTIETALTITNERITLTADTDAGSAPTNILDNVTGATSGTSNDLNYITGNDAGMMQLELAAADVNRVGRMFLSITDAANHVPVFHEFMVLPAAIYDWFVLGSIVPVPANVTTIAGAAVSTSTAQLGVNVVQAAGTAWGSGAITAASIASDAITAAKIADGAIDAATFAASAITATAIAADAITAAKVADGTIDAATFAAGAINSAALAAETGLKPIRSGTAQAGAAGSLTLDASASSVSGLYFGCWLLLTGGTGAGQVRGITAYDGTTKIATIDVNAPWYTTPNATTTFAILPASYIEWNTDWGPNLQSEIDTALGNYGAGGVATQSSVDTIDNFLDTEVAAILAAVDTEVAAILALLDNPRSEPPQGAPPVNPDMATKLDYLYKWTRNKKDNDGTTTKYYADDATTVDHKQTTSEAAGVVTKGEIATGP